jgi:hypothetical protein
MPLPRVIPALADLTQDIAGPLPVTLLHAWAAGAQDVETARALLQAFRIEGSVVATDTSGLSRMVEGRDLLDVLALISAPKSIIHAVGVAAGGVGVGIWVADNSEMFYPAHVPPGAVLDAAGETQARITESCEVSVGMAVHYGQFYNIGGGLYGRDADTVELLAENDARAGEVLVTTAMANRVAGGADARFTPAPELRARDGSMVFRFATSARATGLAVTADVRYPHPFPEEFFSQLTALATAPDREASKQAIYEQYLRERVIVFLSVEREPSDGGLPTLLDDLVVNALVETVIGRLPGAAAHVTGISGGIAILSFAQADEALDLAITLRAHFMQNAMMVKVGIDRGPVLFSANTRGRSGITGDPVNVASKISEDAGAVGRINITARAAATMPRLPDSQPFQTTISGITLRGVFI